MIALYCNDHMVCRYSGNIESLKETFPQVKIWLENAYKPESEAVLGITTVYTHDKNFCILHLDSGWIIHFDTIEIIGS